MTPDIATRRHYSVRPKPVDVQLVRVPAAFQRDVTTRVLATRLREPNCIVF
jgi:hypothetical protein